MQFHLTEMREGENEEALQGLTSTIETNISEGADKTDSLFSSARFYRVPKELRKLNENAYTPRLIAIGPLHQKDEHLKTPFQGVKKSYTKNLLLRLEKMEGSETKCYEYPKVLQECVKEMKDCVDKAKKCYAEELDVSDDHMLEMMLVDGCFILELLYRFKEVKNILKEEAKNIPKEEGQEGKHNVASTSSDLSTPLLQASNIGTTRMHRRTHGTAIMRSPLVGESEIKTSCREKNIDPIWQCNLIATTIQHDLVLLENQIPFFVLEKLFRLTVDRIQNSSSVKFSLDHYVFDYFGSMMSEEGNSTSSDSTTETSCVSPSDSTVVQISPSQMKSSEEDEVQTSNVPRYYYHILHRLHEYCLPQRELNEPHEDYLPQYQTKGEKPGEEGCTEMIMPCASELDYAAVKFEPVKGKDLFKVEFSDPKGPFWWCKIARFKIPMLEIYDETELFLRNLIAFEQCCPGVSQQYFTSYAYLMDMLINSEKDVQVLEQAEIIRNYLGARADATKLFNNLCKEVGIEEFFFAAMCKNATTYSKGRWPKNLAHIRRTYFASPWTFIAFVVAFIAFAIQIVSFVQSFL